MTGNDATHLPAPTAEQRRIAAERFDRANQVINTGNHDYGIQLLMTCCKLDPGNMIYRQMLRRTQRAKFKNNMKGGRFASLTSSPHKARIKAAKRTGDYLRVLEYGEEVLVRNPWDVGTQMDMAEAADALGFPEMAIWILEQARQKDPKDVDVNRALARLYEKGGHFAQAIVLWELIRKARPDDDEAHHKSKDLAASDTIVRGAYEATVRKPRDETEPVVRDNEATDLTPVNDRLAREAAPLLAKIEANPTDPMAYLHLAAIYTRSNKYEEAREILENGLAATGQHFQIRIELSEMELEPFRRNLGIVEEKLRDLPRVVGPDGTPQAENPDAEQELRKIRVKLLKEINAREMDIYRLKADRFPNDVTHRIELGLRLLRASRVEEAIVELQAARKDPRHLWRALMFLGFCFRTVKNWRLAQRNFEEALANIPQSEDAHRKEIMFQLASGHADNGDFVKAVDIATELANLDYVYKDIGHLLEEWQTRLGDTTP
jgi:tetratricopeptide (TPR) repeat protein